MNLIALARLVVNLLNTGADGGGDTGEGDNAIGDVFVSDPFDLLLDNNDFGVFLLSCSSSCSRLGLSDSSPYNIQLIMIVKVFELNGDIECYNRRLQKNEIYLNLLNRINCNEMPLNM